MTNSNDPWLSLLQAASNLQGELTSSNETAFRDALQASLRQERQQLQHQFGTDSLAIFHGEWELNTGNRGGFTLKLGSQRDETLTTNIELGQGRIATIFVDLSRTNAQLIVHGELVIATQDDRSDENWYGSEVTLYHADGKTNHTTLDEDGEFSFPLPGIGTFGIEILSSSGEVLQLDDITVET